MIERRRGWRRRYAAAVADVPGVRVLGDATSSEDNAWLTALVVDPRRAPYDAASLGDEFARAGVETRPLWKPMHLQPVFAGCEGTIAGSSERLFDRGLTLPSGSGMSEEDFARVLAVLTHAGSRRVHA